MRAALAILLLLACIGWADAQESANTTVIGTVGPTINASKTPGTPSAGPFNTFGLSSTGGLGAPILGAYIGTPGDSNAQTQFASFKNAIGQAPGMLDYSMGATNWNAGTGSGSEGGYAGFLVSNVANDPAEVPAIPMIGFHMVLPVDGSQDQGLLNETAGQHDAAHQAAFGVWTATYKTIYVRPEWEFNFVFSTSLTTDFRNAFAHFAATAHAYATAHPGVTIKVVWNPAEDSSFSTAALFETAWYPGDTSVDVIALDRYGSGSGQTDNPNTSVFDVPQAAAFAVARSKPFSMPETGAASTDTAWPGNLAAALLAVPKLTIASINFWDDPSGGNVSLYWSDTPTSAAAWKAAWLAISGSGQILRNGTIDSTTSNAAFLYYLNDTTYYKNVSGSWFKDSGTINSWLSVSSPLSESPAGTDITTVGPSIDASPTPGSAGSGNLLSITSGQQIALNGVVLGGAAVTQLYYTNHTAYQENASLNWFGPITASSVGAQVANPVSSSTTNNFPDLSNAAAHPVTGFPASKIAYSVHLLPTNVSGSTPDQPLATAVAAWNTYFGYLEKNGTAPVLNLSVGCACDNSQGSNADDQAFMANYVAYANGVAPGGPTFTGTQQPMGNAWNFWGASTGNPNGTLNPDGTLKGTETGQSGGQAYWWSQLLQGNVTIGPPPPPQATTWNPADLAGGMTLTGNNLIATSSSASGSVRSTTSKSSGQFCWAITANTITGNWDAGIANSSYSLTAPAGLGGDSNGLGFDPNSTGGLQGVFYNNAVLSSGTVRSVSGEVVQMCADFGADLFWELDAAQVASIGAGNYNNTVGCNPTVAACGISFSGLTCPCFITFNEFDAGGVATIGTTAASLPYALPSGFSTWDTAVVTTGKPLILIFGDNNVPRAANDNRLALAERMRRR